MRRAIVLVASFVAAPAAFAAPALQCNFDGNKTKVVIVNDGKDVQCNYACHFQTEFGSASVSGGTGVKAGETKTVDEETQRSKIVRVREQSLKCE
jgi:hypothetical protein